MPLILLIGFWAGSVAAEKRSASFGVNPVHISNLLWLGLIAGLVGARLTYVIVNFPVFLKDLLGIISFRPGMLDFEGGAVCGVLAGLVYGQKIRLAFLPTLDALTPALAALAIATGFACLAVGECYGIPTTQPWGILLWGELRHPTQVYLILATVAAAGVLFARKGNRIVGLWQADIAGVHILVFMFLVALAWIIIDPFRASSTMLAGVFRPVQILAWVVQAVCLALLFRLTKKASIPTLELESSPSGQSNRE